MMMTMGLRLLSVVIILCSSLTAADLHLHGASQYCVAPAIVTLGPMRSVELD